MVSINNNNLGEKFKIIDTNSSSSNVDELFAELFALINSESELINQESIPKSFHTPDHALEGLTNEAKTRLDESISNSASQTENELDVAKSLVQIFYKEVGIQDNNLNVMIPKTENQKIDLLDYKKLSLINNNKEEIKNKLTKEIIATNDNKSQKTENFAFNIKKISSKDNSKEHSKINFLKVESPKNKTVKIEDNIDYNKRKTEIKSDSNINLVEKKARKKKKQLITSLKDSTLTNVNKSENIIPKSKQFVKLITKNQNINDNKFINKKNINDKNDLKTSEVKNINPNYENKIFLNLLESSWGEKFSKMLKNSINKGTNTIEIELKPKNLGKLNLEISVKQNKTIVNLSSESQEVVNLLNENLSRLSDLIDKESRSFSNLMNNDNNQQNYFGNNQNKKNFVPEKSSIENKKKTAEFVKKISNHNIDVNA